jgi:hypothetical protein
MGRLLNVLPRNPWQRVRMIRAAKVALILALMTLGLGIAAANITVTAWAIYHHTTEHRG